MSPLDRRRFLRVGAGAAAAATAASAAGPILGRAGWASPVAVLPEPAGPYGRPLEQSPGFHRFPVGEMEVTVLSDGHGHLPAEVHAAGVDEEERNRYYASRHLPTDTIALQFCPVLIDTGSRRILIDAGMGSPEFAPHAARLERSLSVAGVAPEQVDLVVLTHAHSDHFGGLFDPGTGELRFPDAEVVVSSPELDFWTAPDAAARVGDWADLFGGAEAFVAMSAGALRALGDRLRTIDSDGEIASGIHGVHSPGHTPGHMSVLAESGGEQLLVAGDAIVSVHVGFERPRWRFLFDLDGDEGVRTRLRLLDRAAEDGLLVSGYHFPFPGVGRVVREGRAYRWLPDILA